MAKLNRPDRNGSDQNGQTEKSCSGFSIGLPDERYFTGLAGILLLIWRRSVKGRYFENK